MATWVPISGTAIQYAKNASGAAAADYYLKFYAAGTTTAISMATTSSGGTTLDKCKVDATGWAVNGSDDPFIPHIDRDYKLVLYTNSADADSNATGSAAWVIDNLSAEGLDKSYTSVASLRDSTGNDSFNIIEIESYDEITYPSVTGPKGGHKRHRTGGTNAAPTVGSPVTVSTIGTGTQAGYVWDGDGVEWKLSSFVGGVVSPDELGAAGGADDSQAVYDCLYFANNEKLKTVLTRDLNVPGLVMTGLTYVYLSGRGHKLVGGDEIGFGGTFIMKNTVFENWIKTTYIDSNVEYCKFEGNKSLNCPLGLHYFKITGTTLGVDRHFDVENLYVYDNTFEYSGAPYAGACSAFSCWHKIRGVAKATGNVIDGQQVSGTTNTMYGIVLGNERFANKGLIVIENNEIKNCSRPDEIAISDDGAYAIRATAQNIRMDGNKIIDCLDTVPVYGKGKYAQANGNIVIGHNFRGVNIKRLNVFADDNSNTLPDDNTHDVTIDGNVIYSTESMLEEPVQSLALRSTTITNNFIYLPNCGNIGGIIQVSKDIAYASIARSTAIEGNYGYVAGTVQARGIYITTYEADLQISNNNITSVDSFGLYLPADVGGNLAFHDNIISSVNLDAVSIPCDFSGGGNALISSNVFEGQTASVIQITSASSIKFEGNTQSNLVVGPIAEIYCYGASLSITDNKFVNKFDSVPSLYVRHVGDGGSVTIQRNVFDNISGAVLNAAIYTRKDTATTSAKSINISNNTLHGGVTYFFRDDLANDADLIVFENNRAFGNCGYMYRITAASGYYDRVLDRDNLVEDASSYAFGATTLAGTVKTLSANNVNFI